jgi:hypothetical protein
MKVFEKFNQKNLLHLKGVFIWVFRIYTVKWRFCIRAWSRWGKFTRTSRKIEIERIWYKARKTKINSRRTSKTSRNW